MPTMISNAAFALKLLWRTVSYIQLKLSPLQSGTLYACVLDFSSDQNFVFNTLHVTSCLKMRITQLLLLT